MGIGRKRGPSGGGASLNFFVKAYETTEDMLAETPKNNTIGVVTSVDIASWIFSSVEPEASVNGAVWFKTGIDSLVAFNALKKNGVNVYPRAAYQSIDGVWVRLEAMSFQDGQWVKWITYTYLYDTGDECTDITGGWTAAGKKANSSSNTDASAPTVTRAEDYLLAKITADEKSGILYAKKTVDLSSHTKLVAEGEFYLASESASAPNLALCLWTSIGTYYQTNLVSRVGVSEKGSVVKRLELDLSAIDGAHIVGFLVNTTNSAGGSYVKIEKCWLES